MINQFKTNKNERINKPKSSANKKRKILEILLQDIFKIYLLIFVSIFIPYHINIDSESSYSIK